MNIPDIIAKSGMVQEGHFLLASGLHSPVYWEKFRILEYPEYTAALCGLIAGHFREYNIDAVAGPTTGGIILAFEVAKQLGVRALYAEKEGDVRAFRRGANVVSGERVLVVDDVLTTGKSVREVLSAVKGRQAVTAGVGVLVDRSTTKLDFGAPLFGCHRAETVVYRPEECPLCAAGQPLVKPGTS
jgi:orotate phosphoribosyltransferase